MVPLTNSQENVHNPVAYTLGQWEAKQCALYVYRDMQVILQMSMIWCVLWSHYMIHI